MVKVEEAEVEVARTDEATSATARAAAVWAAARVVLSVAEVMVLVGMAAMRVAAVAAFKRCTLSADAPIDAPPKGIAKEVSRRHRRVTTAVGEKRHCCGTRQIANRGGGEEGKTLSRSHKRSFLRQDHNLGHACAMRDVIRYECRSGKPGDEHVPAATTQTTETACVSCVYVAASSSVTRESLASSTPHDTTERLSI